MITGTINGTNKTVDTTKPLEIFVVMEGSSPNDPVKKGRTEAQL
jgi:hypothetical protein